jgi:hypothetical protein
MNLKGCGRKWLYADLRYYTVSVRIFSVSTEIQTEHLLNTSQALPLQPARLIPVFVSLQLDQILESSSDVRISLLV